MAYHHTTVCFNLFAQINYNHISQNAAQGLDSWGLENFQRNTLARAFAPGVHRVGLMSHLAAGNASNSDFSAWAPQHDDVILIADVDEIAKPDVLRSLSHCTGWWPQTFHHSPDLASISRVFFVGWTGPAFLYSRFYNFRFEWEFAGAWKHPQVPHVWGRSRSSTIYISHSSARATFEF